MITRESGQERKHEFLSGEKGLARQEKREATERHAGKEGKEGQNYRQGG